MTWDWKQRLSGKITLAEQALDRYLPTEDTMPATVHRAMRYSIFAGGKRLRPILVMAAAEAVGGRDEDVLPAACALEMIHTYSLIHDDLPAMDNDDFRRGRPTNHKIFGEAMAILAGDGLLTAAFEVLARQAAVATTTPEAVVQVIGEIGLAAGTQGMVGGQVADMEAMNQPASEHLLNFIHTHKTGALCRTAVRSGAILAGAKASQLMALTEYAEQLGLAFQIVDDILDIEGDPAKIGKDIGSDQRNQKTTFPAIYGLEHSKAMAEKTVGQALQALEGFGPEADLLRDIVRYILERDS
ncbi:MAG: polyprenyl synthetase family protein [Carboxydocellales bacterium]